MEKEQKKENINRILKSKKYLEDEYEYEPRRKEKYWLRWNNTMDKFNYNIIY